MSQISTLKKLFSYLAPVQLRNSKGKENPFLELLYYRGQYQLATKDALYSDGDRYTPLKIAFKHIGTGLNNISNVLVLGTGLASAVHILSKKGYSPAYTLVEHDSLILQWALELLPEDSNVTSVCADAQKYMTDHNTQYDMVIVDIFNSRNVPEFVTTHQFMTQCRNCINKEGYFVFNYIIQNMEDWQPIDTILREVFPQCYYIDDGINRIVVARA